jgi:RNA polymerase sigma factor (sigma-70 family)
MAGRWTNAKDDGGEQSQNSGYFSLVTGWALIRPARLAGRGLLRTQSDARLVDLVRAGNDQAFDAIVLRYHRPLLRHCRKLLPAARAEDAVQTTFLRALESMRADQRDLYLAGWLHRIAHNVAIDALRRLDSDWEELDEQIDGVEATHTAAERRARFDSVVAGMGRLPERQRRALVLRELEGRSYEEISTTLGVSRAGVRQLLNRARNAMRAGVTALFPPALAGRLATSPPGARMAELADPPGTSALLAKGTAAAAAGALALLAVSGPGDHVRSPNAHARANPPAQESAANAGRPTAAGRTAHAEVEGRRPAARDQSRRDLGREGGQPERRQSSTSRNATASGAGPDEADDHTLAGHRAPDRGAATRGDAGEERLERSPPAITPRRSDDDDGQGAPTGSSAPVRTAEMEDDDAELDDGLAEDPDNAELDYGLGEDADDAPPAPAAAVPVAEAPEATGEAEGGESSDDETDD